MSTIPFYVDPVFYTTLVLFTSFFIAIMVSAGKNRKATPKQMIAKGIPHGIPQVAHFGFWHLLFIVGPVLSWATAKMWPLWHTRGALLVACLLAGLEAGRRLQNAWSRGAGSSDALSDNGLPNPAGILHIEEMSFEIGILLMLLISGAYFQEMTLPMFFGILLIMINHFIMGGHWLLRARAPAWRPANMQRLGIVRLLALVVLTIALLGGGFHLLNIHSPH